MKSTKKSVQVEVLPNGKKALTKSVVDNAFRKQKNSLWAYLGNFAWVGAIVAFSHFFNPACYLCLIPYPFILIKDIRKDIRRCKLQYYGIERPCIDKKLAEYDESPDEWQLWFYNKEGDWKVAVSVDKEFYDATEIGEEFYLVFARGERTPCLWYRKSEWEMVASLANKQL
ncbi:MAG: hypothetical protein IJX01_03305 [Oscillospiraceae bacterium]|nr:hypothetical protein [Oscillospiraceae bacterium]